jgi:Arc/MetJ-type ribon-helix-helix transcriptional regulator
MTKTATVKKSVSMPESLWRFVDKHSKAEGHGMASRTIQKALELLQKRAAKK